MVAIVASQLHDGIGEKLLEKNLIKYFGEFTVPKSQGFALDLQASVVLINLNSAHKQSFTHIFLVGMIAADLHISGENYRPVRKDIPQPHPLGSGVRLSSYHISRACTI
jgi:hypothetical protein